jgi:LPS sulfotransferase NodH
MQHIGYSLNALGGPRRGCKLFFNHLKHYRLSLDELAGAFPGCKFVILYRQSLAEQFVSLLVAKGTKQWMVRQGQASALAQVHVVVDEFKSYCDQMRLSYGEILALPWLASRAALLSYEELSFDPKACLARHICPLLAVSPAEMAPRIRKQNTLPLAERVVNYNEVAELLASPIARQRYSWPQRQAA